jgi:hypothetical protein
MKYVMFLEKNGTSILACIGVNPSTAIPEQLDNTLKKVKTIANNNNFDGWLMYNLYPQRATNPVDLNDEIDYGLKLMNNYTIVKSILNLKIKTVWVAWGDLINERNYLYYCLVDIYEKLKDQNITWKIVDIPTMAGNPRHPLDQKGASTLEDFDMMP